MAKANSTAALRAVDENEALSPDLTGSTGWAPLAEVSGIPLVTAIRPDATDDDVENLLLEKLAHLEAMLMATYGESGETFRHWNDSLQDNFMWSCAEIATECRALFSALSSNGGAS